MTVSDACSISELIPSTLALFYLSLYSGIENEGV